MEIHSEKCVIRSFGSCVNIIECPPVNLEGIACYTPMWYTYCSLGGKYVIPPLFWGVLGQDISVIKKKNNRLIGEKQKVNNICTSCIHDRGPGIMKDSSK